MVQSGFHFRLSEHGRDVWSTIAFHCLWADNQSGLSCFIYTSCTILHHSHTYKWLRLPLPRSKCKIFNKYLAKGVVPTDWKVANITPIFKMGSKTDPGNYRPVTLTSVVCRVMESLLRDSIVSHLTLNDLTVTGAGEVLTEQPLISTRIAFYKPSSPPRSANDSPYIHRFLWNLTGKCFLLTHPKQQWESWHGHFGFTKVLQSVLWLTFAVFRGST